MLTRTLPSIVQRIYKELGNGCVTHHAPSETNPLGQSGVHTFVSDIMDLMAVSKNEAEAWKFLHQYLIDGSK